MHQFDDLIYRGVTFTLNSLEELQSKIMVELEISGSTINVKNLQMVQLQKAVLAIGMFSIFEANLQDKLYCRNGFEGAKKLLLQKGLEDLHNRFDNFICAINVLKHGKGRSYETLVSRSTSLPFRIKLPEEHFFNEGDVAEVRTLIEVDNNFVLNCAELIEQILVEIRC